MERERERWKSTLQKRTEMTLECCSSLPKSSQLLTSSSSCCVQEISPIQDHDDCLFGGYKNTGNDQRREDDADGEWKWVMIIIRMEKMRRSWMEDDTFSYSYSCIHLLSGFSEFEFTTRSVSWIRSIVVIWRAEECDSNDRIIQNILKGRLIHGTRKGVHREDTSSNNHNKMMI